ncbi:hypothetical protein [Helicobacter macacae]|uniref:Uncharacterized protein n=1 Tax=Helicobacter macacae MIT 99-5501 TaxID=1357400 RepID=V8CCK3_9HELI|nr:hypothetical protein [Helicobacter macacae]ETD25143.1 hypothetical protein HMPREF2086_00478 [Helicobacter macacae MIT 99-5501]
MINATISGIHKENHRKHITIQNGKLVTDETQRECVNAILKECSGIKVRGDSYFELDNGKIFCSLCHPIKDDIGRKRIALIVWDKDTSNELIQKTLEVMGLEYERFLELKGEFEERFVARQKGGASKNTVVIVGGIALLAFVAYLLLKK